MRKHTLISKPNTSKLRGRAKDGQDIISDKKINFRNKPAPKYLDSYSVAKRSKLGESLRKTLETLAIAGYEGVKCKGSGLTQPVQQLRTRGWDIRTEKREFGKAYVLYPKFKRATVVKYQPEPSYWWVYVIASLIFLFVTVLFVWELLN